jgi:hypothetical protein
MMDRKEAIERLKLMSQSDDDDSRWVEDIRLDEEAIDMAIKALKDKKARYWKRRWLKQRDSIYFVIHTFDTLGLHSSAEFIKIVLLGGNYEERNAKEDIKPVEE